MQQKQAVRQNNNSSGKNLSNHATLRNHATVASQKQAISTLQISSPRQQNNQSMNLMSHNNNEVSNSYWSISKRRQYGRQMEYST